MVALRYLTCSGWDGRGGLYSSRALIQHYKLSGRGLWYYLGREGDSAALRAVCAFRDRFGAHFTDGVFQLLYGLLKAV